LFRSYRYPCGSKTPPVFVILVKYSLRFKYYPSICNFGKNNPYSSNTPPGFVILVK